MGGHAKVEEEAILSFQGSTRHAHHAHCESAVHPLGGVRGQLHTNLPPLCLPPFHGLLTKKPIPNQP